MDLLELVRVLWRRRLIVVSVSLLAVGLAVYVQVSTPRELEARGFLEWVLPTYDGALDPVVPGADPLEDDLNPYRPNATTGRILEVAAESDAGRERFEEEVGDDVQFEVGQERNDVAALVEILVTGSDEDQVLAAFDDVATMLNEDLNQRQARAEVPPSRRISLAALDTPLEATDVGPPVQRAAIGIVVLGGLLALGLAVAVEEVPRLRRSWPLDNPASDDDRHTPEHDSSGRQELPDSQLRLTSALTDFYERGTS